jgi:hypothetical protein
MTTNKPAQADRLRRYKRLNGIFPDADDHSDGGALKRFCIPCGREGDSYNYCWGDTFEAAADAAAGRIWEGRFPVACYDLDTGVKIELHYGNPILARSEDQGATINELSAEEVAENIAWVADHFDHVATVLTITVTCDPGFTHVDTLKSYIHGVTGVEDVRIGCQEIRQLRSKS